MLNRKFLIFFQVIFITDVLTAQVEFPVNDKWSDYYVLRTYANEGRVADFSIRPYFYSKIDTTSEGFNTLPVAAVNEEFYSESNNSLKTYLGLMPYFKKNKFYAWALPYGYFINSKDFFTETPEFIPGYYSRFVKSGNFVYFFDALWQVAYKPADYINFYTGKGKLFLGNGYRSLWLSGDGAPYNYFRGVVDVWHIKYVWQVGTGYDRDSLSFGISKRKRKYFAMHFLEWKMRKWIHLHLFETVIWAQYSDKNPRGLEPAYLNPLIFYRPVEFDMGSSDNMIMGGGITIKPWKNVFLYSQFLLDEFRIKEIRDGNGWWGNKYGLQAGAKLFFKKFYFTGELNAVRPFTYSHNLPVSNYGMDRQPLAHPDGSNFGELLFDSKWLLKKNYFLSIFSSYLMKGENIDTLNMGADIYWSYDYNRTEYGNSFLQGNRISNFVLEAGGGKFLNKFTVIFVKAGVNFYENNNNAKKDFYFKAGIKTTLLQ